MLTKRSKITLLIAVFVLLNSAIAQAAKTEQGGKQNQVEHSESFWQRWFGRDQQTMDELDRKSEPKNKQLHKEKDKAKDKGKKQAKADKKASFSGSERDSIRGYYREENQVKHKGNGKKDKQKNLPYGLQKKLERGGQLPPGWQTKVAKGEVLDAELLRHSERLPNDLVRRLPVLRDGTEVRRIGDKVVRVMEGNGTVLDVIDLADVLLPVSN
ncbi:MAG: hypothetical protein KBT50_07010 [Cycloclasticus sp.]|nr:hypothetical protein [Cycloclasticus sp.]MBQ0790352.1 hypothetical protein [Cycloclasticus sp.]